MPGLLAMGQGGCGAAQHGGQGSSAAPRRAAGAPGLAQEQPAACAGGTARRPRRRGDVPTPAARDLSGERDGEKDEVARNLTVRSNRAEEGRERELDGRGEASGGNNGGRGVLGVDLAGERLNRAREGVVELRGEVNRLGVRAIEAERRGWSARRPAMALFELVSTHAREEGEGEEKRTRLLGR